jgi:hypothetical protein
VIEKQFGNGKAAARAIRRNSILALSTKVRNAPGNPPAREEAAPTIPTSKATIGS